MTHCKAVPLHARTLRHRYRLVSLIVALCASFVVTAQAQTGMSLMTSPWEEGRPLSWTADAWGESTESQAPSPQPSDTDIAVLRSRLRAALVSVAPTHMALDEANATPGDALPPVTTYAGELLPAFAHEYTHLRFESGDPLVPERLIRQEAAVGLPAGELDVFGHTWDLGAVVGVGHASTNAFHDGQGWYGLATVFGVTRLDDGATLAVGLTYDGNRSVLPDTPLPTLEYHRKLDPAGQRSLGLILGYPETRLIYRPDPRLALSVGLSQLDAATAEVRWQASDRLGFVAAYGLFYDMFHDDDDPGDRRLFWVSQRVEAGASCRVTPDVSLSLTAGYLFDQQLRRGFDGRHTDELVRFDDAPFARLQLELHY